MTNPPLHPICRLFPRLSDDELDGLAEDIRRRGLLEPVMLLDGQVLRWERVYREKWGSATKSRDGMLAAPLPKDPSRVP